MGVTAKASTHHHSEVNLSWLRPEHGNAPTAYRVDLASSKSVRTRDTTDGSFNTPVSVLAWNERERDTRHTDPTYDHRGWRPRATPQAFNYRVFAKDGGLIGEASQINTQTVDGQTAPEPVVDLKATVINAKQIDVSWTEPGNDGGTAITSYCFLTTSNATVAMPNTLCVGEVPDNIKREIIDAPAVGVLTESAPDTMYMSKGLLAATTYRHQVYATNQAADTTASPTLTGPGFSPGSDDDPKKTLESTKPVAPAMLAAEQGKDSNFVANQDRGIVIMWNGPADPDGANIEGYEIQRKVNDGDFELRGEWSNRTTHFTDTSQPAPDEVRMYQVRARNKLGWSPWSAAITSPLTESSTMPPAAALTKPSNVAASSVAGTGMVTVTWTDGQNADEGHVVLLFTSDFTEVPGVAVPTTVGTHTFTSIPAGDYVAVVVSVKSRSEYLYDYDTVTVQ